MLFKRLPPWNQFLVEKLRSYISFTDCWDLRNEIESNLVYLVQLLWSIDVRNGLQLYVLTFMLCQVLRVLYLVPKNLGVMWMSGKELTCSGGCTTPIILAPVTQSCRLWCGFRWVNPDSRDPAVNLTIKTVHYLSGKLLIWWPATLFHFGTIVACLKYPWKCSPS